MIWTVTTDDKIAIPKCETRTAGIGAIRYRLADYRALGYAGKLWQWQPSAAKWLPIRAITKTLFAKRFPKTTEESFSIDLICWAEWEIENKSK